MATKVIHICDRCGKKHTAGYDITTIEYSYGELSWDLCDECRECFEMFIKNKGDGKNE